MDSEATGDKAPAVSCSRPEVLPGRSSAWLILRGYLGEVILMHPKTLEVLSAPFSPRPKSFRLADLA
jgi:hypothetical protein